MSLADQVLFREASATDMPGISHVRLAVIENALSVEQLQERGITNASVAASLLTHRKGWVAEQDGQIVAFSMADRADWSIFALFVLPGYEQRGLGGHLLDLALGWLWDNGAERVWLSTGRKRGRRASTRCVDGSVPAMQARGDLRFELSRPAYRHRSAAASTAMSGLAPTAAMSQVTHRQRVLSLAGCFSPTGGRSSEASAGRELYALARCRRHGLHKGGTD